MHHFKHSIYTGMGIALLSSIPVIAFAQTVAPTLLVLNMFDINYSDIGAFFNRLFELALLIGGVLAVIMIAIGGIQYMTTEAASEKKGSIGRIKNAVVGLLMMLSIGLFYNQINPDILKLDFKLTPINGSGKKLEKVKPPKSPFKESSPGRITQNCNYPKGVSCTAVNTFCSKNGYRTIELAKNGKSITCKNDFYYSTRVYVSPGSYVNIDKRIKYTTTSYSDVCGKNTTCTSNQITEIGRNYRGYTLKTDPNDSNRKILIGYPTFEACTKMVPVKNIGACQTSGGGSFWNTAFNHANSTTITFSNYQQNK